MFAFPFHFFHDDGVQNICQNTFDPPFVGMSKATGRCVGGSDMFNVF